MAIVQRRKQMRRFYPLFAAIIMLVVAALACCPTPPTPIVKTPTPAQVEEPGQQEELTEATEEPPTAAPEPTEEQAPLGSSRSNPAPRGSEVAIGGMTLAVGEVVRPADEIVAEANPFNDEPEEGHEYLMLTLSVTCNKGTDETCDIAPSLEIELVGSSGVVREPELFIAGVDGELEAEKLFGGATKSGKLFFQIGKEETDLVLIYSEFLGTSKVYLAVE